jgi:hypothetical protein
MNSSPLCQDWRRRGLLALNLNLQGGSPQGYSQSQPGHHSAFDADGGLLPAYLARLERILFRLVGKDRWE